MKKSIKKLALNKITIANLNAAEMSQKHGGSGATATGCCGNTKGDIRTIKK